MLVGTMPVMKRRDAEGRWIDQGLRTGHLENPLLIFMQLQPRMSAFGSKADMALKMSAYDPKRTWPQILLLGDVGCFHQLKVGGDVLFEKGAELGQCHRHRIYVNRRQALPHGRQSQCLHHLIV